MKNITIYTTKYCNFCHAAKDFFNERGFKYNEKDVQDNPENLQEMISLSNQMGVPVIKIDNEIIMGFDRARLEEILEDKSTA